MVFVIVFVAIIALCILFYNIFKIPKINAVTLVTGAVKAGKSATSVRFAVKMYKKVRFRYFIRKPFRFLLGKPPEEEPLLYSNIPLKIKQYRKLTRSILERSERIPYKSVVFIDEATLLADQMLYKDEELNERLTLFFKLFGHMTHGGYCIINTQCIQDCHYAVKRSISQYFYVHHSIKIPFFVLAFVREKTYSEDATDVNVNNGDLEDELKIICYPKSVFKLYDCYAFSSLTDDNLISSVPPSDKSMKVKKVLSFRKWKTIENDTDEVINHD